MAVPAGLCSSALEGKKKAKSKKRAKGVGRPVEGQDRESIRKYLFCGALRKLAASL